MQVLLTLLTRPSDCSGRHGRDLFGDDNESCFNNRQPTGDADGCASRTHAVVLRRRQVAVEVAVRCLSGSYVLLGALSLAARHRAGVRT